MTAIDAGPADDLAGSEGRWVDAVTIDAPGADPRRRRVALPPRRPGSTLLRVVAAPLNPLDLLIASGTFHSARHELPYVPGSECVGVVVESERYRPGSVVYAECHASPTNPGAFATQVIVGDKDLLPLPDGVDHVQAAAVGNSGTAAYLPLIDIARLKRDETVLVLGATGAVGQLAVQVARLSGAGRVIGLGRDRATLSRLTSLGADDVVELRAGEDAAGLVGRLETVAGPVDVILDGLYGMPLEAALQVCAPRARVVNIGHLAGATAQIPAGLLRGKQLTVSGFAGLHTPLPEKAAALTWLWSALSRGQLRLDVNTVSLDDLRDIWRAQSGSPHVKNVVLPETPRRVSAR